MAVCRDQIVIPGERLADHYFFGLFNFIFGGLQTPDQIVITGEALADPFFGILDFADLSLAVCRDQIVIPGERLADHYQQMQAALMESQ